VGVVAMMLVHPPAEGQPDGEVAEQQPEDVVGPPGPEDLPVARLVAQTRSR
jgi:hypothetical protein